MCLRREILNPLKNGWLPAGEIGDHFPVTAASISRPPAVLREADHMLLWITNLKGEACHVASTSGRSINKFRKRWKSRIPDLS